MVESAIDNIEFLVLVKETCVFYFVSFFIDAHAKVKVVKNMNCKIMLSSITSTCLF